MFVNRLPQSYQHLDVITAARLLAIRSDAQGLTAPPAELASFDDENEPEAQGVPVPFRNAVRVYDAMFAARRGRS